MFKVSKGNSKLGNIYNINLPAITSCRADAPCKKECYANKGTYRFKAVRNCYAENWRMWQEEPLQVRVDILAQLPKCLPAVVRWHSSGDIPDINYFHMMVAVASLRPSAKFLVFTKQYEIVNKYIEQGYHVPSNLKVVFSMWYGLDCPNPHNLPTSIVNLKDKESVDNRVLSDALPCAGHCSDCYICWKLEAGEQVIFNQH